MNLYQVNVVIIERKSPSRDPRNDSDEEPEFRARAICPFMVPADDKHQATAKVLDMWIAPGNEAVAIRGYVIEVDDPTDYAEVAR